MEQVTCTRLLWDKAMLEEDGMPHSSTAASPTLRACAHGAEEEAQGNCVTQFFSGPGCCHLLPLIDDENFQKYPETWPAFSPLGAELPLDLAASSKEATAGGFGEFDSYKKPGFIDCFQPYRCCRISMWQWQENLCLLFSYNEHSIFIIKANGIYLSPPFCCTRPSFSLDFCSPYPWFPPIDVERQDLLPLSSYSSSWLQGCLCWILLG